MIKLIMSQLISAVVEPVVYSLETKKNLSCELLSVSLNQIKISDILLLFIFLHIFVVQQSQYADIIRCASAFLLFVYIVFPCATHCHKITFRDRFRPITLLGRRGWIYGRGIDNQPSPHVTCSKMKIRANSHRSCNNQHILANYHELTTERTSAELLSVYAHAHFP